MDGRVSCVSVSTASAVVEVSGTVVTSSVVLSSEAEYVVSSANAGITQVCIRPTESKYIVPFFNICLFIKILPIKTSNHDQAKNTFSVVSLFFGVSFPYLNKFFVAV